MEGGSSIKAALSSLKVEQDTNGIILIQGSNGFSEPPDFVGTPKFLASHNIFQDLDIKNQMIFLRKGAWIQSYNC